MERKSIAVATATLAAFLLATAPACATTITVADDGSGMYTTIQDGIDAASPGDTVEVKAGTYSGPSNRDLDFGGVPISLIAPSGWEVTSIYCDGQGRGFLFHSGEDTSALVSGFTIMNAAADSGAGASCRNGSSPKFLDCKFFENQATHRGGGLYCRGSSPVIRHCSFHNNGVSGSEYPYGGALACEAGSAPVVADTRFGANQSEEMGGAVYCHYAPATFARCDFEVNNVGTYGNGGAAVALTFSDGATLTGCTFVDNGLSETAVGGGIYVGGSTVTVSGCEFIGNSAGQGGAIQFTSSSSGTVSDCLFAENTSIWSSSAGVSCNLGSEPTISGCSFVRNNDYHLFFDGCSPTVEYSILAYATDLGTMVCSQGSETPHIHHCFVYHNAGDDTLCGGNYHDIEYADPRFCGVMTGNYTLCADSPCLPGVTWPSLVGSEEIGCSACNSLTEPATWGALKAIFR